MGEGRLRSCGRECVSFSPSRLLGRMAEYRCVERRYGTHPFYLEHRIDSTTNKSSSHGVFLLSYVPLSSTLHIHSQTSPHTHHPHPQLRTIRHPPPHPTQLHRLPPPIPSPPRYTRFLLLCRSNPYRSHEAICRSRRITCVGSVLVVWVSFV